MIAEGKLRDILAHMIGRTVIDISQDDPEDLECEDGFIQLMFDDGNWLKVYILDSDLYKAPGPVVFNDPQNTPSVWVPTAEEAAAGSWAVVDVWREDQAENHVIPTHGKNHTLDLDCWCKPTTETTQHGILMVKHNEEENGEKKTGNSQ